MQTSNYSREKSCQFLTKAPLAVQVKQNKDTKRSTNKFPLENLCIVNDDLIVYPKI